MVEDMKFEESFLTRYLVKNLEHLTEADPVILAEYVAALLKKDKPRKELQKLCSENLVEFLGPGTKSFVTQLFQALEDGSIVAPADSSDVIEQVEPSTSLTTEDPTELKNSSSKPDGISSSGRGSDLEDKEVSDDDDDDRNHKHRRRGARSESFDKDVQGQFLRKPNRKRNRPFENGQMFLEGDPRSSENRKEYNPALLERDHYGKFERKYPGLVPLPRSPFDSGFRTRVNQTFHGDPGPRFDLSTSLGRPPIGRGRGRSSGPWSQHDSKFSSSVDTLDFVSQMGPQGAAPPSLFASRGLQPFGLISGMTNGGMDTLHPLGFQGTLGPPINQSLSIGMPHQRCGDFEERGFCLRGDMCPMEHGVNRIVVEDVQSLSQFNLPVSLPSARLLGTAAGAGSLPMGSAPSTLLTNSKTLHGKSSKPGMTDDGLGSNRVLSASTGADEADLYDPDQPLWNNDHPGTSSALIRNSSPKVDESESLWNADPSDDHNPRSYVVIDSEHPGRSITSAVSSQSTSFSVWGRIGTSENKLGMTGKLDSTIASMGYIGKEAKDEERVSGVPGTTHKRKQIDSEDVNRKAMNSAVNPRMQNDPARRPSQKALRTLFVNGIPLKNNKREALLSHFRKFGEVVDIYIPLNSERAFIQFSKREEAEAALKAPDAVMGNRFIKLWWANRDNIPDNGVSNGNAAAATPHDVAVTSVPPLPSVADGGKENLSYTAPKGSAVPDSDAPVPAVVHPRPMETNGPKAAPPSQKKLESLELLKEELRLKQEMLDQKRNDFRRQLDRLEKQAITVKGEATAEQAVKRHKVGTVIDVSKAANPKPTNPGTTGHRPGAEKTLDKSNSGENIVSPSSKTYSATVLQSARNFKQPNHLSVPLRTPFLANRFKLDNRPTTFRILPPLPANLANVIVLREHFSSFGDLIAVELEETEASVSTACSETSENCSARLTFTTRQSAERAFLNGKCWQGHNLQFLWLTVSTNSSNDHTGGENSSTSTPKGPPNADALGENITPGFSSSSIKKSTCISQAADSTGKGESDNSERIKDDVEPMNMVEACCSSHTAMSSCKTWSPKADTLIVEDGTDIKFAQ